METRKAEFLWDADWSGISIYVSLRSSEMQSIFLKHSFYAFQKSNMNENVREEVVDSTGSYELG